MFIKSTYEEFFFATCLSEIYASTICFYVFEDSAKHFAVFNVIKFCLMTSGYGLQTYVLQHVFNLTHEMKLYLCILQRKLST